MDENWVAERLNQYFWSLVIALTVYRTVSSCSAVDICSVVSDQWDLTEISQTFVLITQIGVIIAASRNQAAAGFLGFVYILFSYGFWHYRHKISWMDRGLWSMKPVSRHRGILLVCLPAQGPLFSQSNSCTAIKVGHSTSRLNICSSIDMQSDF